LCGTVRVAVSGDDIGAELHTAESGWQPIDLPEDQTAEWLADGLAATQVIVAGVGLGHALASADRLGLTKILAIEPDPGLATLFLSRRDWRQWFAGGRLRLLTGPDYRGAADTARFLDGLAGVSIVSHPRRARVDPRSMAIAAAVAGRIVKNARANGEARRQFAGPYLLQTLQNLPGIAREAGVEALDKAFTGVAAIVVGAGPSLDSNIPALKRYQDHAVIIAADTALGPLVSGGVRPHLAVAADSSALNARHLATPVRTGRHRGHRG
jgi:hypothetical protein